MAEILSKLIKKDTTPINIIRDIISSFSNLSTVYFSFAPHEVSKFDSVPVVIIGLK